MVAAAKLLVLNPGKFELWKMRIKQYFLMTDYTLWEVIVNGDSPPPKRTIDGVEQIYPPTTTEEKLARKNELKARGTLLMDLPNKHQLKFNSYKNSKSLMKAIEKRFGDNKESNKTQKTLLKKQYENFNGSSLKGLDQTYNRLQKLISQLEILGETISQEDMNLKLLKSLPSECKTHTLIWRNKPDLETLSMDDLYNNLKIYETEVKGSSSTSQNIQNIAFVSSNITSSTNEAVKTAHGVFVANSKPNASTLPNVDSLRDAVIYSFFATRRFHKKTGRNLGVNGTDTIGFDKTKVECYNCHIRGHFSRECWAPMNQDSRNREITRRTVPVKETTLNALVSQCDGFGYDWSDQAEEGPSNHALMAYTSSGSSCSSSSDTESQLNVGAYKAGLEFVEARLNVYKKNEAVFEKDINILKLDIMLRDNALIELKKKIKKAEKERNDLKLTLEKFENSSKNLSKLLDSQVSDKFKTGVGYDNQVYNSQVFDSQKNDKYKTLTSVPAVATSKVKTSESKSKFVCEPLIEDWISNSKNENETECKSRQRKPSNDKVDFVKTNKHVKSPRESINKLELQEKGVIDSGCSRHMTRNKFYLSDYKEIDGGFVAFGGNPKAGQAGKKTVPSHEYILLPLWTPDSPISSSPKRSDDEVPDDARKKSTKDQTNEGDKDDQDLRDEFEREFERLFVQGKEAEININNTNSISAVSSPINTARTKDVNDEPMMANLEDTGIFSDAYDDEDFVVGGDMNNLESSMFVSPIATIRVHKDHPFELIIGDLHSAPQTRRMTKNSEEHVEPKKVIQALTDPSWIEAMQDELLQFKLQKGYTQEDGIDYDEVFSPVARIKIIRLFLAYASFKDFVMYQMDVKSAFLYGKIKEEVYVYEPPGFEDPEFPDRVYKRGTIDKTLFIKKFKGDILLVQVYVDDIVFISTKKELCTEFEKLMHKKFQMSSMASTPMETSKPLMKDENAEDVDVHLYRLMIGSLMYLTSSRPDIMFVLCACLWYLKDSPFDLEAYTDSDYVGASLDRKSTTGGCQFLRSRLISWQCKKQTVVANSTTEAEYVAASNCCGQGLWIQNQLLDYGYMNTKIFIDNESTICIVKNPVFHLKTKHIEIRHHFIRDSNEKKLIQMIKIHTYKNVVDLLTKAFNIIHKGWLNWNATTAEDGIEVKTGDVKKSLVTLWGKFVGGVLMIGMGWKYYLDEIKVYSGNSKVSAAGMT
ncbi:putative ribonuclease H-like domain-containing protein [Tanacetum coccineum]